MRYFWEVLEDSHRNFTPERGATSTNFGKSGPGSGAFFAVNWGDRLPAPSAASNSRRVIEPDRDERQL